MIILDLFHNFNDNRTYFYASIKIDELLAELSTDSPFDILGPTELPADLLDLLFQTTESPIIDLFTVPENIELPAATTADTLIEVESTVPVTASTSVSPSGVTENDTAPSTTARSTTTTQSGLLTAEVHLRSIDFIFFQMFDNFTVS